MSILITGASGYLGGGLKTRLGRVTHVVGWQNKNRYPELRTLDIRDRNAVHDAVSSQKPSLIVHFEKLIRDFEAGIHYSQQSFNFSS